MRRRPWRLRSGRLIAPYGVWVNDACFLLAPFKLLILLYGLRLKLAKNGWLAFVFAAFGIYMAESLILRDPFWWEWSRDGYCYLLSWMPLVFAAILPPVRDLIQVSGGLVVVGDEGRGFITAKRRRCLNHAFLWLPLAVLFAHFVESLCVHEVFFYPMHLAPIVLALGVLWVRNSPKDHVMARMLVLDALVSLAIVLSLPAANVPRPLRPGDPVEVRVFMFCKLPLAVSGALVIALYWYFYRKFQYRPALYRVMVVACAGVGAGLLQTEAVREVIGTCWSGTGHGIEWIWVHFRGAVVRALRWIARHPISYLGVLWAGLVWLAWKYRNVFTLFVLGAFSIQMLFGSLPGGPARWMPEILQSLFLLGIALDHGFSRSGKRQLRYCLAWAVMLIALARFLDKDALCTWGGVVVALESTLFIAGGILLRHPGYALVGALEGLAFVHAFALSRGWYGQPALIILTAALAAFVAGVTVTFNKRRILDWLGEGDDTPSEKTPRSPLP